MQRIGGSLGTALLAVVLQGQISDRLGGPGGAGRDARGPARRGARSGRGAVGEGFAANVRWAVGISVLALIPATVLAVNQKREREQALDQAAAAEADTFGVKQEVFEREWAPAGDPRATVALVHGLGEHSGRYEKLAERFTQASYGVRAIHLRGHGESPGARRHALRAGARAHDGLVERCGTPVFLYGHSLGALLAVLWLLERPGAPVAGAVVSAIGLHSALKEQAAKVRAARVLGRAVPRR